MGSLSRQFAPSRHGEASGVSLDDMQASEEVLEVAGDAWDASLNQYGAGGDCTVTTQQIGDRVYLIGQDDFTIVSQSVSDWCGEDSSGDVHEVEAADANEAWKLLKHLRKDCLLWQCRACVAWIYTSNQPRIGILRCSICGDVVVDFRQADRHVGSDAVED